jgi:hypothetical protein
VDRRPRDGAGRDFHGEGVRQGGDVAGAVVLKLPDRGMVLVFYTAQFQDKI